MAKPIEIRLPISETSIHGKSQGSMYKQEYFIRFIHDNKSYDINRLSNWKYSDLLDLFNAFKEAKGEQIIWDEKYILDLMEKKSQMDK